MWQRQTILTAQGVNKYGTDKPQMPPPECINFAVSSAKSGNKSGYGSAWQLKV